MCSYFVGPHPMPLIFNGYEVAAMIGAAWITSYLVHEGRSNWFEGLKLLAPTRWSSAVPLRVNGPWALGPDDNGPGALAPGPRALPPFRSPLAATAAHPIQGDAAHQRQAPDQQHEHRVRAREREVAGLSDAGAVPAPERRCAAAAGVLAQHLVTAAGVGGRRP